MSPPATAPHDGGVLVIDDSGDRKDDAPSAHVGHQWLGRRGKIGKGVVTLTERFSSFDLAGLKNVDGLGQWAGPPRAAAEFAQDAPGFELGVGAFAGTA